MAADRRSLLIPPLSSAAAGALYRQIVDGVKREISEGRLAPGATLPSVRQFAEDLRVSVITVGRAYDELERDGLIHCRQGVGAFVAADAGARSRSVKMERARRLVIDALREAREAGLRDEDALEFCHRTIDAEGAPRHVRKRR